MSLLLKALQRADRGSDLSLQPMEPRRTESGASASGAQSTADMMFAKQAAAEQKRMLFLIGALALTVLGMGGYFYIAVYMPWLLLPKPPAPAPAPVLSVPAPQTAARPAPPPPPLAPSAALPAPAVAEKRAMPTPGMPTLPVANKPAASATKAVTPADGDGVHISAGSGVVSTEINRAYQLLQEGRLNEARGLYEKLRATEPRNADAVLGLAVIAQRQDRPEQAAQLFLKALEIDPKNLFAQASLTGMIARADPSASEAKFKQLLTQQPAAYLHFALGNLYAAQGRWPEAQTAYFDAQRLAPDAPDYAFNLAISLEHIGQPKAALDYYQRALRLAQTHGAAFDANLAAARIRQLANGKTP